MNAQNISVQIRRLNLDEISLGQNLNAHSSKIYGTNKSPSQAERKSNLSPKSQSGDYAIDVRGLTKKFGKKIITDGVDIRVKKGSVCGF